MNIFVSHVLYKYRLVHIPVNEIKITITQSSYSKYGNEAMDSNVKLKYYKLTRLIKRHISQWELNKVAYNLKFKSFLDDCYYFRETLLL